MGVVLQQENESRVVALEGVIDISSAADLKAALMEAMNSSSSIAIVFDDNTEMDVTAYQLLWAARKASAARDIAFSLRGRIPRAVEDTLKEAALESLQFTA